MKDEDDPCADEPDEEEFEAGDKDDDADGPGEETNLLTDFQYEFDSALRQPSRNLIVKDLMVMFDASTVYGRRAGFHKALLVTASASWFGNLMWAGLQMQSFVHVCLDLSCRKLLSVQ